MVIVMKKALFIVLLALYGCSSMLEREKTLQVLHLVDVAQTYQVSKSPCHYEMGAAGLFIGENPSESDVVIWGLATAVAYHYAEKHLPDSIMDLNVTLKFGVVENNNREGIRVGGYTC